MKPIKKGVFITAALVTLAALGVALWLEPAAEAQLGGQAQVTRLELRYTPSDGTLAARYHLASGLAVDAEIGSDAEIDRLLQAAEILASGKARMSATVESGRVKSWSLSVP